MLIALGRTTLLIASATCLAASPASSQERQPAPDLSGTWVMDVARSASAAAGGHSMPDQKVVQEILVIQQTADELVIERRRGERRDVISYSFAPAPQAVAPPAEPQPVGTTGAAVPDAPAKIGSEVQEARAEHKDGRVVIRLVLLINGKTVTTDDSLWLGAGGRELIVQRLLQVHHGYQGPGTKAASEAQDVYIRSDR